MKLLTIMMPCYNVEAYLNKGLSTLASKKFEDALEVLIIDDGSTDRTAEIASKYVQEYPKIFRLVQKENGGHGSAINEGIRQAKGKYFRILDGDDWVLTEQLGELLERLLKIHADLVVDKRCEVHMVTGEKNHIPLPVHELEGQTLLQNVAYPFEHLCSMEAVSRYFMIHNFSVKTELLRAHKVTVLEGVFYEDSEYVLKATSICKTITFVDLEIYQYMIGNVNQSVSTENFVKRFEHFHKVTCEMLAYEKENKRKISSQQVQQYMTRRCRTVVLTEYYIALIYDTDRKRGRQRGKMLYRLLQKEYPDMAKMTAMRYRLDCMMHFLGVNYHALQLMRHALIGGKR